MKTCNVFVKYLLLFCHRAPHWMTMMSRTAPPPDIGPARSHNAFSVGELMWKRRLLNSDLFRLRRCVQVQAATERATIGQLYSLLIERRAYQKTPMLDVPSPTQLPHSTSFNLVFCTHTLTHTQPIENVEIIILFVSMWSMSWKSEHDVFKKMCMWTILAFFCSASSLSRHYVGHPYLE